MTNHTTYCISCPPGSYSFFNIILLLNINNIKIVMRSVFIQYSRHKENITKEIECLNHIVIDYCVPKIYSETKGYLKYLHDASTMHIPIDHPTLSGCHNKTLKPNPFV